MVKNVSINKVKIPYLWTNRSYSEIQIKEMAEDIRKNGQLFPIQTSKLVLLDGLLRLLALKSLNSKTIKVKDFRWIKG